MNNILLTVVLSLWAGGCGTAGGVVLRDVGDPGITLNAPAARCALDLLRQHESVNGTQMVGDGGLAQGWLGQHEDNWNEGCAYIGQDWKWPEDTRDLWKCELVAMAYWCLYSLEYLDNTEELIRRHRLPFAPYRIDNDTYLRRVLACQ